MDNMVRRMDRGIKCSEAFHNEYLLNPVFSCLRKRSVSCLTNSCMYPARDSEAEPVPDNAALSAAEEIGGSKILNPKP